MPSAYSVVAAAVKGVIDAEFAAEGITAIHDRVHASNGWKRPIVGISPESQTPRSGNEFLLDTRVLIQFYNTWDKEIDPEQVVDPRTITDYAHRLMQAIESQQASYAGSSQVWYFKVENVQYPNDATGNKTRFHMTICAYGDNTALLSRL